MMELVLLFYALLFGWGRWKLYFVERDLDNFYFENRNDLELWEYIRNKWL